MHKVSLPVVHDGETIASLTAYFNLAELETTLGEELFLGFTLVLLLLTILLVGTLGVHKVVVGRPIDNLLASIARLRKDNAYVEVAWHSKDEIGQVVDSFNELIREHFENENKLSENLLRRDREITRRTQAELELKKHRDRLEEMITERTRELQWVTNRLEEAQRLVRLGNWERDLQDGSAWWSEEVFRILGRPYEPMAEFDRVMQAIHPHDRQRVADAMAKALRPGAVYDVEYRILRPDDEARYVHSIGQVSEWSAGEIPLKMVGALQDITEAKRAEEKIEAQEARFRSLFESSSDAIMMLDEEGYLDCNEATLGIFGCDDKAQFIQLHPAQLSPPLQADGTPSMEAAMRKIDLAMKQGFNLFEWTHWRYNTHQEFAAEVLLNSFQLDGKTVLQAVVRDISQRKEMEKAMLRAKQAAEDASEAKSEFLANMSHEIRTPLNAVLGLARMGARDAEGALTRDYFERINESGSHLLRVINDILDFSKIEAGKLVIEEVSFDLQDTIAELSSMLSERALARGLDLSIEVDGELPGWVKGDPYRLQQVLLNLLSNAIKFTESGGVVVRLGWAGGMGDILVRDTGIGMSAETIACLREPFEQGDASTTRRFGGSGLGLAISFHLTQLMGGRIEVQSEPGVGSSFRLVLPLPEAGSPALQPKSSLPEQGQRLAGVRVLAAEDVEINQLILEDLLVSEGATVTFADNGQRAVDAVEQQGSEGYDVVLMDIQMPVMNGYQATEKIKQLASDLPVIGLTAHAFEEEKQRCIAAGMCDHLSKPIDPEALVASVVREVQVGRSCCNTHT